MDRLWVDIENEICAAFAGVRLGDGIGYHEAGAIDDHLNPESREYLNEKAKDERSDWAKLLAEFEGQCLEVDRHCFMDTQGLLFYLPILLLRKEWTLTSMLQCYVSETYKREGYGYTNGKYTALVAALTKGQRAVICHFYEHLTETDPNYDELFLNGPFDASGETAMQGFDFMDFLKRNLGDETLWTEEF